MCNTTSTRSQPQPIASVVLVGRIDQHAQESERLLRVVCLTFDDLQAEPVQIVPSAQAIDVVGLRRRLRLNIKLQHTYPPFQQFQKLLCPRRLWQQTKT